VKGLGEVTAISAAPNAVYHATGKRVRDLPITVEKISEARDGPEARRSAMVSDAAPARSDS